MRAQLFPALKYKDRVLNLPGKKRISKLNYPNIKRNFRNFLAVQNTFTSENTVSIKPKMKIVTWNLRSKSPWPNFVLCSISKWPSSNVMSLFEHDYWLIDWLRGHLWPHVHHFSICIIPTPQTCPAVYCCHLEYFIAFNFTVDEAYPQMTITNPFLENFLEDFLEDFSSNLYQSLETLP